VNGNRVLAVLFLLLALVLSFATPEAAEPDALGDPGPALLPRLVGLLTGILAVILFFQRQPLREEPQSDTGSPAVIALSLAAIPAFYLAFEYLGYTVAVAGYLFAAFCLLGLGTPAARFRYLLAAAAFSLVSGLVFSRLLDLPLPGVVS